MEHNYKYLFIRKDKIASAYNLEIIIKILNKEIGFLFVKLNTTFAFTIRFS